MKDEVDYAFTSASVTLSCLFDFSVVLKTHRSHTLRTTFISCILYEWMYRNLHKTYIFLYWQQDRHHWIHKTFEHLHTFIKSPSNQSVQRQGKLDKSLFAALSTSRHPNNDLGHNRLSRASAAQQCPGQNQQQLWQQPHFKVVINTTSFGRVNEPNRVKDAKESALILLCRLLSCWAGGRKKKETVISLRFSGSPSPTPPPPPPTPSHLWMCPN